MILDGKNVVAQYKTKFGTEVSITVSSWEYPFYHFAVMTKNNSMARVLLEPQGVSYFMRLIACHTGSLRYFCSKYRKKYIQIISGKKEPVCFLHYRAKGLKDDQDG